MQHATTFFLQFKKSNEGHFLCRTVLTLGCLQFVIQQQFFYAFVTN